jgi:hypothetical protein
MQGGRGACDHEVDPQRPTIFDLRSSIRTSSSRFGSRIRERSDDVGEPATTKLIH